MGMFDTVTIKCPHCKEYNLIQTKAHICQLNNYHYTYVPLSIAGAFDGREITCSECGGEFVTYLEITGVKLKTSVVE